VIGTTGTKYCNRCGLAKLEWGKGSLCADCEWEVFNTNENGQTRPMGATESVPADRPGPRVQPKSGIGLDGLHAKFEEHLYLPDLVAVDVAAATVIAHRQGGDPLWTFFVSPPSAGKTEIVNSVGGCPEVYRLSSLTGQTFVSGFKGRSSSLLNRLDDAEKSFLTLKDFTTVLSLHRDARGEIMGALREIYDGEYSKDFGNGQSVHWTGRLGFLAGVTPVIDRHHQVLAVLGQRFLMLRLPPEDRDVITTRALAMRGRESQIRGDLREAMTSYIAGVDPSQGELATDVLSEIVRVSRYATQGRTGVERDGYTHEVLVIPELEVPTRFAKAIASLASALLAMGYTEAAALEVVARVGRDSIPPIRVLILGQLIGAEMVTTADIANATDLPITTVRSVAEDLTMIGLMARQGEGNSLRWSLAPDGAETIKALAIRGKP
jgi:hypothetical protein